MRGLVVITAPAALAVELDEAKRHLHITASAEDDYLLGLIEAATAKLDGPAGRLRRALINQTLELRLDEFPYATPQDIELPLPPFVSITSVKYTDTDNAEQTITSTDYRVIGGGAGFARLALAYDKSWPSPLLISEALRIRYIAGYGATSTDVPAAIRHMIMMDVGHLYRSREAVSPEAQNVVLNGYQALFDQYRVYE